MESQRVRLLIEGYLRGWLNFDYTQRYSIAREDIILTHIHEERLYGLLQNKLLVDTVLTATSSGRSRSTVDALIGVLHTMIGLKLPLSLPKDRISKDLGKEELAEWKSFLEQVNKK